MNFEETEVLYNVYRGILRNNRSFQPGKSTAVEYRMDCPEYADLLKKYPFEKIAGKGTDLQRAIRVLKYLSPKLTHSPWYDGHVDCNAIPTAEGCIGILMAERTRTLWNSAILLAGFGPVGQALGVRLAALGAQVTVAARRPAQRALAESFSLRAVDLARLEQAAPAFDTVVNTIPAPVLTEAVLAALRPGSLIVDLASKPGGTDFAAARRLGHRAIHALSLPAACAPETAGEALARTVCEILAEREETP